MAWRGPRTANDPRLTNHAWRKVKQYWIDQHILRCQATVCYLPGIPIDYTKPFTSRASFNCGHIVSRAKAKRMGWTDEQAMALENTRPEHRLCNLKAGAREGQRAQQRRMARAQVVNTSRRW
jgi:hypothetical protein